MSESETPKRGNAAIRVFGGSDNVIRGVRGVGLPPEQPLLDMVGAERTSVSDVSAKYAEPPASPPPEPVEEQAAKPREKPGQDHWYKKPGPIIIWGVITSCIVLSIRYILGAIFGIEL